MLPPSLSESHLNMLCPVSSLTSPISSRDVQLLLVSVSPARCMSKPYAGETESEDPAFEGLRRIWGGPISSRAPLLCHHCSMLNSPGTVPDAQRNTFTWKAGCGETSSPQLPSSFPNVLFYKDIAVCWVLLMSQRVHCKCSILILSKQSNFSPLKLLKITSF